MLLLISVILLVIWYLVAEFLTAKAWVSPRYRYYLNTTSDLGVSDRHTDSFGLKCFADRTICSPRYWLINGTFFVLGLAYIFGVGFLVQETPSVLTVIVGLGMMLLAFFNANNPGHITPKMVVHWVVGGCALIGGPINTFLISSALSFPLGQVLGIIGAVCGVIASCYWLGFTAIPQRIGIYSMLLSIVLIAIHLL